MQWLREGQYEALNATKVNSDTETFEELEKLRQNMEDKKGDDMEIDEEKDMLMKNLSHWNIFWMKRVQNQRKDMKPSKYCRNTWNYQNQQEKPAENSTCLH